VLAENDPSSSRDVSPTDHRRSLRMQHFDRNKEDLVYPVYLFQRCFICHERQKWHIQVIYDKK
jgi:hypothetical protein